MMMALVFYWKASRREVFYKIGAPKNCAKFKGRSTCVRVSFLTKLQ